MKSHQIISIIFFFASSYLLVSNAYSETGMASTTEVPNPPIEGFHGIAILIGNEGPSKAKTSSTAIRDLDSLATGLNALRFNVISAQNAGSPSIRKSISEFERQIIEGQPAVFIFGGQAREKSGTAWLLPYAKNPESTAAESDWIKVDEIAQIMTDRKAFPAMIILDCWWAESHVYSAFTRDLSPMPSLPNGPKSVLFVAMPRALGWNMFLNQTFRQHSSYSASLAGAMESSKDTGADAITLLRLAAQSFQKEVGENLKVDLAFDATMSAIFPASFKDKTARSTTEAVAKVVSARTPAEATKDLPFVNSLGMRFVPVQIVGEPTGKRKVLFSVWETRNRDLLQYYRDTGQSGMWETLQGDLLCPAGRMTQRQAVRFCEWLSRVEKRRYRLPTDHEWSCAVGIGHLEDASASPDAKDGKVSGYPWEGGYENIHGKGNFSILANADRFEEAAPVGSFPPNEIGLYDMAGNVWERCNDINDPNSKSSLVEHTVRGGGFNNFWTVLLSSSRGAFPEREEEFDDSIGFRCVLELDDRPMLEDNRYFPTGGVQRALLIGQAAYPGDLRLRNPINDAEDTANELRKWGFQAVIQSDLGSAEMEDEVRKFAASIGENQVAFVFYAGHGIEIDGVNYLVPVDCEMLSLEEIRSKCLPAQKVLEILGEKRPMLTCLILDCCRKGVSRGTANAPIPHGLATMKVPPGIVVAYSTAPGEVAEDGEGHNSPYTTQFLDYLRSAEGNEVELVKLFREVSRQLHEKGGFQQPWVSFDGSAPNHIIFRTKESLHSQLKN